MPGAGVARYGELLRRLLLTRGYMEGNVLEDYFPVIDLFANVPELYKLRDEQLFAAGGIGLGAVGAGGRVWFMNKLPGRLVVIDQLRVGLSAGVGGNIFADLTTTGLPADGAGGQSIEEGTDSRYGTGTPGTTPDGGLTVANDTAAVTSGVPFAAYTSSTGATSIPVRYVLRSGYALVLSSSIQGAGNNFLACATGYSRAAEDSELK